jgi:membrane protein required for colicin V production
MLDGMMAEMNGLDYAIMAIVGICALSGLTRGALRMATSILALVLGIYAASVYYQRVAAIAQKYLGTNPSVSAVIGYAAIFLIVYIAIEYVGSRIIRLAQIIHLNWIDRLAGAILGASIGAVLAGLAVVALTAALPADPALLRDSKLAPRVLGYNQALMAYVPEQVKTTYEEKRNQLYRQWVAKNQGPTSSPSPAK